MADELSLEVDYVKQGYGITNDGNTAKRAFSKSTKFAEILGLDQTLLKNFQTILIFLSCQLPVKPEYFIKLCRETAKIYVKHYSWYPMPATVHKILIHGGEIILNSVLPVGMLGEDAREACHKYYRKFRLDFGRKTSRIDSTEDVFLRRMDTSDPILSSIDLKLRMKRRKKLNLPKEVLEGLAEPVYLAELLLEELDDEGSDPENQDVSGLSEVLAHLEKLELANSLEDDE